MPKPLREVLAIVDSQKHFRKRLGRENLFKLCAVCEIACNPKAIGCKAREARNQKNREWQIKNPAKTKQKLREWYRKNREKILDRQREYRSNNEAYRVKQAMRYERRKTKGQAAARASGSQRIETVQWVM